MSIDYEFNLGFDRIKAEMAAKIDPALLVGMEYIKTVVTPLVPIETGDLAGSGDVGIGPAPGDEAPEHTAHLYYPGPYALYQHEGVYYRHGVTGAPLTHTHGESFFLLRPMIQESDTTLGIVKKEMGL